MNYEVHREVKDGRLVRLYLGIPEVDAYLDFLKYRCRLNTWINYAHDLQVFVNAVSKPLALVKPRDIFAFIQQQRETPSRRGHGEGLVPLSPGLSPRTIKRLLSPPWASLTICWIVGSAFIASLSTGGNFSNEKLQL